MSEPGFKPVFGPNGAVMNAPTMTPDMHEQLVESAKLPTPKKLMHWARVIGGFAFSAILALIVMRLME